jgi:hypothetical protein
LSQESGHIRRGDSGVLKQMRPVVLLCAVAILLSCVLLSCVSLSSEPLPETKHDETSNASTADNPGQNKNPKSRWERIWERTWDDPIAFYTFMLAVFTGVLGTVSIVQIAFLIRADKTSRIAANAARESAEITKQTLVATQRPWIQVKLTAAGPLVFGAAPEDQEARIELAFLARNVGNSPAIRVSLDVKLTISNTIDLRTEQKVYSDGIRKSREQAASQPNVIQPEITLFPGEQFPLQAVAYMNAEPLAKFREWAGKHPGAIILPAIVGSVFYEFTFAKGHHQTGIIYAIHKRTPYPDGHPLPGYAHIPPGYPITNVEGAIPLEGAIPDSDLVLRQNIVGTGPID